MTQQRIIIIGAGPAGLTAAYEILERTSAIPILVESEDQVGGISKTFQYHGNYIDIGGHRFFSKSDKIVQWWTDKLPLQGAPARDDIRLNRTLPWSKIPGAPDPEKTDKVMLYRRRVSRVFAFKKFFDYPVGLSLHTLLNLGVSRITAIILSYFWACLFPIKPEKTLRDFFINRFGQTFYRAFFKNYTHKVWGISSSRIDAAWGAQRIKGVSIGTAITHAFKRMIFLNEPSVEQKQIETSLIDLFIYPKFGPGQLWDEVAERIRQRGGKIKLNHEAVGFRSQNGRVTAVEVLDKQSGCREILDGDHIISTMPVKNLVAAFGESVPEEVKNTAKRLEYRDFITVGLLVRRFKISNGTHSKTTHPRVPDHWLYIQDRSVKLGRIQIFNNWSPYLVQNEEAMWLGLEYFCNIGDTFWKKADAGIIAMAIGELVKIGFLHEAGDALDAVVIRMPKAYPAYYGTYTNFAAIRDFTDSFKNLFLIGRNGMHRYNNMDHSMMTAMAAVNNIVNHIPTKDNIWAINTKEEYLE